MNPRVLFTAALVAMLGNMSGEASAEVDLYFDHAEWQSAMGATTTIDFTGLPDDMLLPPEQYADLGIIFTDGLDLVQSGSFTTYPQDGAGLNGLGPIELLFTQPMYGISTHFPGYIIFELYAGDEMIYESVEIGNTVYDFFGGLISDRAFDRVILRKPGDLFVQIDNLYFGPPIPSPAALAIVLTGFVTIGARRRGRWPNAAATRATTRWGPAT